jgi:hypothetical protein
MFLKIWYTDEPYFNPQVYALYEVFLSFEKDILNNKTLIILYCRQEMQQPSTYKLIFCILDCQQPKLWIGLFSSKFVLVTK